MISQQLPKIANQAVPSVTPIDPKPIVEQGESPTAIILAIAMLISILVGSITELVRVIVIVILRQTKSSR